jgi:hypothetical protein
MVAASNIFLARLHQIVAVHGWPCDIHTYVEVTPPLAAVGFSMIVPYLRGYCAGGLGHCLPQEARTHPPGAIADVAKL